MSDLLFATNNQHKLREIQEILGSDFRILSLIRSAVALMIR